ncbi:MAG: toxin-antitoxin system HicB family antitoxin [Bryobacteraceae bacterium]
MLATKKESIGRVSVALPPDLHAEIGDRAEQNDISLNRVIVQLLRAGLEAERQKKQRLEEMLLRYRESTDPQEVERLGDELGAIIFGR